MGGRYNIDKAKLIKIEKESGKLRMGGGAWTIPMGYFTQGTQVREIEYITEKAVYRISADTAIAHGFSRSFKDELKLIVPLKHWTILTKQQLVA